MSAAAVIVAGGQGARLGSQIPKAFVELDGRPLFTFSLAALDTHPAVAALVLVVPHEYVRRTVSRIGGLGLTRPCCVVAGGEQRWQSVRSGVLETPAECDTILVHDAARPFVTHAVIDAILNKTDSYRSVITVTPVVDTIRTFEHDRAGPTVDRRSLVRVGTPQLFRRADLLKGFDKAGRMAEPPTDEAMLMQSIGVEVGIAWGDDINFKITTPGDLRLAHAIVATAPRT